LKLLIQRVSTASVEVDHQIVSAIKQGILAFVGFDKHDSIENLKSMAEKLLNFKTFNDEKGKISKSLFETNHQLLIVPQVTLSLGTKRGTKPSFSDAAEHQVGLELFQEFTQIFEEKKFMYEIGSFGSDMLIHIVNDGPVTFWFEN